MLRSFWEHAWVVLGTFLGRKWSHFRDFSGSHGRLSQQSLPDPKNVRIMIIFVEKSIVLFGDFAFVFLLLRGGGGKTTKLEKKLKIQWFLRVIQHVRTAEKKRAQRGSEKRRENEAKQPRKCMKI